MHIQTPAVHVDHMLKQTRQHHVTLSSMADAKANMLLTMSSVVATLCLPQLSNLAYRPALGTLMFFCLITIFFACYAVMPKMSMAKRPDGDLELSNPNFNPMFFGDFHTIKFDDYLVMMERTLNDSSLSYEIQLREIYGLGQYLAKKKYRLLRYGYLTFLTGFGSAAVILIITMVMPSF
ncbi:MAG: DUF5706 domain-containing protein [Reinekea forsetii]|uniref:Pycsar effector protein domain-containing protein n=1 Tax=Reinekea forsetii TaxID=1336806 RepID=A0A2K8KST2_9GAMM|nr:Pycsar system effector family protein [Reinekea forsetii]ATX76931.1 hypothetical protein REIFOR_01793 [Reinekea forsetii]MDO7673409.1 DUF5706 domain-containing protein [Reinekea forsetii]